MSLKFLGHFVPFILRNQAGALNGVHSADQFRAILNRERARANRNGHDFSLVLFDPGEVNGNSARTRRLVQILSQRVRATDEIGWFDGARIGIVLPYTAADAAWKMPSDVCQMIGTGALPFTYTVYTYPARRTPSRDTADPQRWFSRVSP